MNYVLITHQPGAIGSAEDHAYTVGDDGSTPLTQDQATGAGHLLADGSVPPMTFQVLAAEPLPAVE